jgi:integrase
VELKKAIELFLSEQRTTTGESYRTVLKRLCNFLGPARPAEMIRPADLVEYMKYLDTRLINGKPYAPATLLKHVKTLKVFFNRLVALEIIERSPARVLKQKKLPVYISRDKAMSDEELALLLEVVKYKERDYALLLFLADTGCRISGAAGLTIGDLELEDRRAWVTEKGEKRRQVAYGYRCAMAMIKWLLRRPKTAGEHVFSRTKTPLKAPNISQMIRRACQKIGIRVLSGHSLRHRKGHQLADQRTAPSIAATALGHSDPTITLRHYYPADWETAERELQKLVATEELRPTPRKETLSLMDYLKSVK